MEHFVMPRVSLSDDEEMVVSRWLVSEGDEVAEGQPVLEVETAKANMEVEAPRAGVLVSIMLVNGASVGPGDLLAVMIGSDESFDADAAALAAPTRGSVRVDSPARAGVDVVDALGSSDVSSRYLSAEAAVPPAELRSVVSFEHPGELYGLPARRRLATAVSARTITDAPARASVTDGERDRSAPPGATEVVLTKHRIAIGRLMSESWRIPQFAVRRDLVMDEAERTVASLRVAGLRATLTDVILRAVARALVGHPEVNRLFVGDQLFQMPRPVLGLAMDSPTGVVAPVLHEFDVADWAQIVAERQRIVQGAREGRLLPRDLNGGTFSVSNVGPLGGDAVTPLITPPQVAILGVGAVRSQSGGRIAAAQFVGDHRALDGADAARFLATLADLLADPAQSEEMAVPPQ